MKMSNYFCPKMKHVVSISPFIKWTVNYKPREPKPTSNFG